MIIQNLINKLWFRSDDIFTIEDIQKQIGKEDKEKFSHSISENAQGALLPLWSFCTPLCHGRIIPLFPAVEKGFSGICPPKRPISPLCPTSRRKWKLIFV